MILYENVLKQYLKLKRTHGKDVDYIALPCISTGAYRFSNREAAHIAMDTVRKWLEINWKNCNGIIFNCFLDLDYKIYGQLYKHYFPVN